MEPRQLGEIGPLFQAPAKPGGLLFGLHNYPAQEPLVVEPVPGETRPHFLPGDADERVKVASLVLIDYVPANRVLVAGPKRAGGVDSPTAGVEYQQLFVDERLQVVASGGIPALLRAQSRQQRSGELLDFAPVDRLLTDPGNDRRGGVGLLAGRGVGAGDDEGETTR